MNFYRRRYNLYFVLAAFLTLVAGCALWPHDRKQTAILSVHIESESSAAGPTKAISVERSQPVMVNVATDPILTEADVVSARLLNAPGGFAVELNFEASAGLRLEQFTASNPGKHLAIFGQWSEKPVEGRWLAAPIIVRRMGGNRLSFTPDASHEEMEKWVAGLNEVAKKNAENGGMKDNP